MVIRPLVLVLALFVLGGSGLVQPEAIRVVSYNIKHGRGNDNVVNLDRTAGVLRTLQPDIVGLQEVDDLATRTVASRRWSASDRRSACITRSGDSWIFRAARTGWRSCRDIPSSRPSR